ncbi:MAG: DUF389 domain-containing protein [Candidatus Nanopelagicales bacterium]
MLHLRIYSPSPLTDQAASALDASSLVSSLAVVRDVGIRPPGDLIMADIPREAANEVIDELRSLGIQEEGAIQIDGVTTWISRNALQAEEDAPGAGSDTVVWAEVTQRAYESSELTWSYASFMLMATVIASIGIVLDSQILLIGAMVLGPEFGAVAALGLALVRRRRHLLHRAARTLALGFAGSICVTSMLALIARLLGWVSIIQVEGPRPLTEFIYTPDRWSVIIALLAGAAGVLALTSSRTGGLTGVFISVTTVPAAGNVALALAFGAWPEVVGSSLQLAINVTGMALAGWATLAVQQGVWRRVSTARGRG